ncbi:MAG TPA: tRNA 4-thiouridine(8) synthase ThiI [Candidatus Monoglobus merdigallinarum]|uniref:Probable tRNA sulfurtransferase n=1 Tax=Candidatus Monoglobus merdigallinarum TaxID=2838698 RepID=A0A9D1TLY3_9FIRM|nr:tRNA 4-thiouridine(8) synthase ThiI [Candidatus Monoglobus merdigallinarum]
MHKIDLILLKYGEIALKGLNRPKFEQRLLGNISSALAPLGRFSIKKAQSTVYVKPLDEDADMNAVIKRLKKVFGIVNICPAAQCDKDMESIKDTAAACMAGLGGKTFKVETKREDKNFPLTSPQISREVGGHVLKTAGNLKVDVHDPDILLQVEIREEAYVYAEKFSGAGGMPSGSGGRAALLLSGGIDSPVAGWMVAKRGVTLDAVYFHSPPYTSERAKDKVIDLAKIVSEYSMGIRLYSVPFTDIQLSIIENCPKNYLTIIMRRIMMRIAEKIAVKNGDLALVTGESIGQVASQTLEALRCTDAAATLPVFRPCIGMDKEEIVTISKKIDAYETSIQPYEDCCTIFVPKHPKTRPHLDEVLEAEKALSDIERMIDEAVYGAEVYDIYGGSVTEISNRKEE